MGGDQGDLFPAGKKRGEGEEEEWITTEIQLLTAPIFQVAKSSGKIYCLFSAKGVSDGKQIEVRGVGDVPVHIKSVAIGDKVSLRGKWDGAKFIGVSLHKPGRKEQRVPPKVHLARQFGSIDEYRKARDAHHEAMRSAGKVPLYEETEDKGIYRVRWEAESACILHEGRWVLKIDFLMDKLGADRIAKELSQVVGSGVVQTRPAGGTGLSRIERPSWAARYEAWIEERLQEVLGEPNPFI